MSNIKRLLEELGESFVQVRELNDKQATLAVAYLNAQAGLVDKDWNEHTTLHGMHPSMNCSYCVENADIPEEEQRTEVED